MNIVLEIPADEAKQLEALLNEYLKVSREATEAHERLMARVDRNIAEIRRLRKATEARLCGRNSFK